MSINVNGPSDMMSDDVRRRQGSKSKPSSPQHEQHSVKKKTDVDNKIQQL
ncbi:hypothetical protein [Endozoicomonas atrinae]